ncbi:MAG: hypothetical protein ACTSQJ_19510, partial [Promethearchaeota archaeon]
LRRSQNVDLIENYVDLKKTKNKNPCRTLRVQGTPSHVDKTGPVTIRKMSVHILLNLNIF